MRVLVVGADAGVGGVAGIVYRWSLLPALRGVEWHITISDARAGDQDKRFATFRRHELPITYSAATLWRAVRGLRDLIRREKIDILHLHTPRAGFVGAVAASGTGIPIVYSGHSWGFEKRTRFLPRIYFKTIERYIASRASMVTCEGERERLFGIRHGLVPESKAITTRTPVFADQYDRAHGIAAARERFAIPPSAPLLGMNGRMEPRKRPLDFVEIAARVLRERPECHFLWIGGGELHEEAMSLARSLSIADRIHVTGLLREKDVPPFVNSLDILLFTSELEGVPLGIIEAQTAGCLIVTAAYPGVEEIVKDGESGFVYPIGDRDQGARAVLSALADPVRSAEIASRGQALARKTFGDLDRIGESLAGVYDRVTKRKMS